MGKTLRPEKMALVMHYLNETNMSYRDIAAHSNVMYLSLVHNVNVRKTGRKTVPSQRTTALKSKRVGRPKRINERMERLLLRTLTKLREQNVNFTVEELINECDIDPSTVSRRTVSRYLNKWGYRYLQARKKELLSEKDKRNRIIYARRMKKVLHEHQDFYANHIAFYLDGVSFVHKHNPFDVAVQPNMRVWRKRSEGLRVTGKGSKELAGGRRLHLIVAIAFGKGVILRSVYDKMNGSFFRKIYWREL